MKALKIWLILLAVVAFVLALGGAAFAFHDGGVAYCEGCHTMHNSLGGVSNSVKGGGTVGNGQNQYLLKGSDPSSTCLNCHQSNMMGANIQVLSNDGTAYTPGGDFYWLNQTYTYTAAGGNVTSKGENHGHNVIAGDFGLTADDKLTVAPGSTGKYAANNLACNSCHNPHGRVNGGTRSKVGPVAQSGSYGYAPITGTINGNYRLLADSSYVPGDTAVYGPQPSTAGYPADWTYSANAPVAVTDGNFREAEGLGGVAQGSDKTWEHTDYGTGISEWCANCHDQFLNNTGTSTSHRHPAGDSAILGGLADLYNTYVASGNYSGASDKSYLPLVPFERGSGAILNAAGTSGPAAGGGGKEAVMCLSCHRAHASAFDEMTRWDTGAEFMSASSALIATSKAWAANAPYYGWDIVANMGTYQRNLCNKCHVQD
ncbi:MAG: hypothetical protein M0033_06525 [Nitrospiraceae bacterium]|nr:hypothetical protein [Nitrospiraceae bacterium]